MSTQNQSEPTLHVHIWNTTKDPEQPIKELDVEWTEVYDDHVQFTFEHNDEIIEIRVWYDSLKEMEKLVQEMREYLKS